jgi:hypothetical protein
MLEWLNSSSWDVETGTRVVSWGVLETMAPKKKSVEMVIEELILGVPILIEV